MTSGQIDDRKAPKTESNWTGDKVTLIIRAAMDDRSAHSADRCRFHRLLPEKNKLPANATHFIYRDRMSDVSDWHDRFLTNNRNRGRNRAKSRSHRFRRRHPLVCLQNVPHIYVRPTLLAGLCRQNEKNAEFDR